MPCLSLFLSDVKCGHLDSKDVALNFVEGAIRELHWCPDPLGRPGHRGLISDVDVISLQANTVSTPLPTKILQATQYVASHLVRCKQTLKCNGWSNRANAKILGVGGRNAGPCAMAQLVVHATNHSTRGSGSPSHKCQLSSLMCEIGPGATYNKKHVKTDV